MCKKRQFCFFIVILSMALGYSVMAQEAAGEEMKTDVYIWDSVEKYDAFLENPQSEELFCPYELVTISSERLPLIGFPVYSDELHRVLNSSVIEETFLYSKYPDLKIFEKKLIRPSYHYLMNGFSVGELVLYSTSEGLKAVEYKKDLYQVEAEEGTELAKGYHFVYYDTFEQYASKYRAKELPVYLNGQEMSMSYTEVRNGNAFLSVRSVLEAAGIKVDWIDKYQQIMIHKEDQVLYAFIEKEWPTHMADLLLMQKPQYLSYIQMLDGISSYEYPYFYPISDYLGSTVTFPMRRDRLCAQPIVLSHMAGLFGKELSIDITNESIQITTRKTEPIPWYPVPQTPEEAQAEVLF